MYTYVCDCVCIQNMRMAYGYIIKTHSGNDGIETLRNDRNLMTLKCFNLGHHMFKRTPTNKGEKNYQKIMFCRQCDVCCPSGIWQRPNMFNYAIDSSQ